MIRHNDDAFATMLLCCQITPDREELSRPLSANEWHALRSLLRERGLRMSELLNMDMSACVMRLDISEEHAYRVCLLLSRVLALSVLLEQYAQHGIDVATIEESAYPQRLRDRLGVKAPPVLYFSGRPELFMQDAVAILGGLPARGACEETVRLLAREASEAGYAVLSDGQQGVSRIASDEAIRCGGRVIEFSAQSLTTRIAQTDMKAALEKREAACLTLTHPDSPFTAAHAIARNKCVYAMATAAFVVAADSRRGATWDGATEALRNRYCDFIYAWDNPLYPGNALLCAQGATVCRDPTPETFHQMARNWRGAASQQLSMFDNKTPL